jgi:hypothetical protein
MPLPVVTGSGILPTEKIPDTMRGLLLEVTMSSVFQGNYLTAYRFTLILDPSNP